MTTKENNYFANKLVNIRRCLCLLGSEHRTQCHWWWLSCSDAIRGLQRSWTNI